MTAAGLVAELGAAGIRLAVDGDRLVARGRRLPADLADRLRQHKGELVALLRAEGARRPPSAEEERLRAAYNGLTPEESARLDAEAADGDTLAGLILATVSGTAADGAEKGTARSVGAAPGRPAIEEDGVAPEPAAWLLYSRRLDRELWLLRDAAALELIRTEQLGERPVLVADDVPRLRGLDVAALNVALEATRVFPGTRLSHAGKVGEHPDAGRHDDRHGDHPDREDDPHQHLRGVPMARKAR